MKASVLKTGGKRTESRNDRGLGIQTYGEFNDYPQRVKEIAGASGTGKACVRIYAKFIAGRGFADENFYKTVVNLQGHTNDYLLNQIARDYADYNGFALHVNYNSLFQIIEVQHVPFENIRFEKLDDNGMFYRVATHPDWGRRHQALRKFKKDDIVFYNLFNPDPEAIQEQVDEAGGWEEYTGQIFYYSEAGERVYPTAMYDAVLTDMSTEEGIGNVKYRNARNNFLPSGMLIDKRNKLQTDDQEDELDEALTQFQTDENACKLLKIEVQSEEEIPEFVAFDTRNYDKEFEYSEKSTQQNIGRIFNIPPILRAEDVGASFGADLIANAYNYYNAVTETERLSVERVFEAIYLHWFDEINTTNNYTVLPLVFGGSVKPNNYADNT